MSEQDESTYDWKNLEKQVRELDGNERLQDAVKWIIANDHLLFPLEGESELTTHARILTVFGNHKTAFLRERLEAAEEALREIVAVYEVLATYPPIQMSVLHASSLSQLPNMKETALKGLGKSAKEAAK